MTDHTPDKLLNFRRQRLARSQVLTGQEHGHWLELLGYTRFRHG